MSTIYKILFEVKVLHEYYLTKTDGDTVFVLEQQQERMDFLLEKFRNDEASINDKLDFTVPEAVQSAMKQHRLRLLPAYSGFKIAMEVKPESLADGTTAYRPYVPLPSGFSLLIALTRKTGGIDSFTNARLGSPVPSLYYFSNDNVLTQKTFPDLSNRIPDFDPSKVYEQGELALFGVNEVREFFTDTAGDQWRTIKGDGFVNETDRLLVPVRFDYSFSSADNVTSAEFKLKDEKGNVAATYRFQGSSPLQKVSLDFRNAGVKTLPETISYDQLLYTLEVTGNNGFSRKSRHIFLNDKTASRDWWGLIHIKPVVSNKDFSLVDEKGFLITRRPPGGTLQGTPVFELRLTSRLTFWRYKNNKGKKLDLTPVTTDFLDNNDGVLITKTPRPITRNLTLFKKEADSKPHYLPNPSPDEMMIIENKRFIFDILVLTSDLFPVQT